LKNDVDSIINYLTHALTNKIELSLESVNDFQLSIKTIGFVTKHMAKEIRLVDIKTMGNSELYHRNNISKKLKNWIFDVSLDKKVSKTIESEQEEIDISFVPVVDKNGEDETAWTGKRIFRASSQEGCHNISNKKKTFIRTGKFAATSPSTHTVPVADNNVNDSKKFTSTFGSQKRQFATNKFFKSRATFNTDNSFPKMPPRENNSQKTTKVSNRYEILNNLAY
jgi:hypothetical protein